MNRALFKGFIVAFIGTSLGACGDPVDGGGGGEGRVCDSTVYYQELLGVYKGQITANVFFPGEDNLEPRRQCVWNVSMLLKEKIIEVNETGRNACFMDAFYRSELVSKKETPDSGSYECVEVDGVFTVLDDHWLEQEFWNAPVWPVAMELSSSNEFHPATTLDKYITPLTGGSFSGDATFIKRDDGLIDFHTGIGKGQLEGFLTKQ